MACPTLDPGGTTAHAWRTTAAVHCRKVAILQMRNSVCVCLRLVANLNPLAARVFAGVLSGLNCASRCQPSSAGLQHLATWRERD